MIYNDLSCQLKRTTERLVPSLNWSPHMSVKCQIQTSDLKGPGIESREREMVEYKYEEEAEYFFNGMGVLNIFTSKVMKSFFIAHF